VASVENDVRLIFKNPLFVIPGSTPVVRFQNLVNAILGMTKGDTNALYKQLFTGRRWRHHRHADQM